MRAWRAPQVLSVDVSSADALVRMLSQVRSANWYEMIIVATAGL